MSIPGKQTINVGLPNEPANSDSLYTAFTKVNQNFSNLFACSSPFNTFTAGPGIGVNANANAGIISITNQGVTNIIAGTNIAINQSNGNVTISSTGSGNGGGLSSVGITPVNTNRIVVSNSPLVADGNISIDLAASGVAGGVYNNPTLTIDNFGRVVSAANGNIAGTVTSVGLVSGPGIQISGGPVTSAGNITVTNTGVTRINAGSGVAISSGNGNVTISATSLGGTVTSVGIASQQLVITGSPVVGAGTINVNLPANANFNNINANSANINGNLIVAGNISPAAPNKVGGIVPGPGVNVSLQGELTIDTANLPLSFGNFTANTNVLSIVNLDEDMILQTEGNAEIQLIGNIGFYKPDGLPPNVANRYFSATGDGQITILVSNSDPFFGGVEIVGSTTGNIIAPGAPGTMLHITGQVSGPARVYIDGNDDYVSLVARRWNGNVDSPTQVLAGDYVLRINSTAATDAGVGNVAMAQIGFVALENQTTTAQGSKIEFNVTAIGNTAANRVEVANITVANGVSATGFTTAGNVTANNANITANISANNVSVTSNITAGNTLSSGAITSNSATAGIGYSAGAGGTVTQLTNKSTSVTLNTVSGEITMSNATLSGDGTVSFTLNNSTIANTDVMIINQVSTANVGLYAFNGRCNTGNAIISVHNMTNNNRSDAIVIRYAVIKGATN